MQTVGNTVTRLLSLSLQERNGDLLLADSGLRIIEQLSGQAYVSQRQQGALVLGLRSAQGAKSMVDTPIGKVCGAPREEGMYSVKGACAQVLLVRSWVDAGGLLCI